ncbi:hypothetical protein [Bacillus cereus group sp. IBL03679]|uniref:hypothetical protein n=1 Tax=Bacillus cereus group sp. IBL03679 TaxID=3240095 RepID=UPI003D2F89EB
MDLTFSLTKKMEKLIKKLEKRQKKLVDEYENKKEIILKNPGIGKMLKGHMATIRYFWGHYNNIFIFFVVSTVKRY